MAGTYGKNRLATGFTKPSLTEAGHDTTMTNFPTGQSSHVSTSATGNSPTSAIELSDDEDDEEMGDSEGGIVLNLEGARKGNPKLGTNVNRQCQNTSEEDEDDETPESGEISDDSMSFPEAQRTAPTSTNIEDTTRNSFVVDPSPMHASKKLADLSPARREEQIKYAFYHLKRDEIDLSRPVICLKCFDEGHMDEDCQQTSLFPALKILSDQPTKLWISCCICASKDHLVGDCAQADKAEVIRWSLAEVNPAQITNLSLESGTRKREKEADNRGMRPQGLSIRGRAGRHTAGFGQHLDLESSDDDMFHHFKKRGGLNGPPQSPRHRRGGWYGTDSFGRRRRSHSPPEDHRPARYRRSPSPRENNQRPNRQDGVTDAYRPPPPRAHADAKNTSQNSGPSLSQRNTGKAPTSIRPEPAPTPRADISINLPTRKGSKSWASETSAQSGPSAPVNANQQQAKRGKRGGRSKRRHKPN